MIVQADGGAAGAALHSIWSRDGLPEKALEWLSLSGRDPVYPSSFAVGAAAQSTLAAAALAACELAHLRGAERQRVSVDMLAAAVESTGWFTLDGQEQSLRNAFSGLYRCADGMVRVHTNFDHHRDGALRLLGLDPASATRADADRAMLTWKALDFEQTAAEAGMVATALRSFDEWDATPQGRAVAAQALMTIDRNGEAPPLCLPPLRPDSRPLEGVRVLDLTRILAGPVCGRTLAALGADVMLINAPHLPNIASIAETSRGKRSALVDLRTDEGRRALWQLVDGAHVFVQGYRPGALDAFGFSPAALTARRPGLVQVSLSAYGTRGPWAGRRGFDSLIQTAMGFNVAEGEAAGGAKPRELPMQMLDQASGFLMAYGAAAALWHQQRQGGGWRVGVSLAQTGHWLRGLGRVDGGFGVERPDPAPWADTSPSGFGLLRAVRPSIMLERTPLRYARPSVKPGTDRPEWSSTLK